MTDEERAMIAAETTPPTTWQDAALALLEAVELLQRQHEQLQRQHDALAKVVLAQDYEAGMFQ